MDLGLYTGHIFFQIKTKRNFSCDLYLFWIFVYFIFLWKRIQVGKKTTNYTKIFLIFFHCFFNPFSPHTKSNKKYKYIFFNLFFFMSISKSSMWFALFLFAYLKFFLKKIKKINITQILKIVTLALNSQWSCVKVLMILSQNLIDFKSVS